MLTWKIWTTMQGRKNRMKTTKWTIWTTTDNDAHLFVQDKVPQLFGAFEIVMYDADQPSFLRDAF